MARHGGYLADKNRRLKSSKLLHMSVRPTWAAGTSVSDNKKAPPPKISIWNKGGHF